MLVSCGGPRCTRARMYISFTKLLYSSGSGFPAHFGGFPLSPSLKQGSCELDASQAIGFVVTTRRTFQNKSKTIATPLLPSAAPSNPAKPEPDTRACLKPTQEAGCSGRRRFGGGDLARSFVLPAKLLVPSVFETTSPLL